MTLGIIAGNQTTIGLPTYDTVFHDGIHIISSFSNTTAFVESAATINIGTPGTPGGYNGISVAIDSSGSNTISIQNTGPIGNATNPVGYNGIFGRITADNDGQQTIYVSNTMPIFSAHDGIHQYARDDEAYNGKGSVSITIFNTGNLSAGYQGIHAHAVVDTYGPNSVATATVVITNGNATSGSITSHRTGIYGNATADAHE